MKKNKYSILIASGVNLDLIGRREPEIYGHQTLEDMESRVRDFLETWLALPENKDTSVDLDFFQSNDEAQFLEIFGSQDYDGAVINPGAWTHTSLALADRLKGLALAYVEVHLSQVLHRAKLDPVRSHSFTAPYAMGLVSGFGIDSYVLGLKGLLSKINKI